MNVQSKFSHTVAARFRKLCRIRAFRARLLSEQVLQDLVGAPRRAFARLVIGVLMLIVAPTIAAPTITFVAGPRGAASDSTILVGSGNIFITYAADLRGDGRRDLILGFGNAPPIMQVTPMRILRPNASGTGMTDVTRQLLGNGALPSIQHPREIVTGDFNGDGKQDIFVAAHGFDAPPFPAERNVLLISKTDGTYANQSSTLPSAPDFSHSTTVGDVNGDGIPDIFVGNLPSPQIAYFLIGNGDGSFKHVSGLIPIDIATPGGSTFLASLLVDVDGDGFPDLVLASSGDGLGRNVVLLNDGTGDFTKRSRTLLPTGAFGTTATSNDILSIDINGDGRPDLLVLSTQSGLLQDQGAAVQALINQGGGVFTDETQSILGASASRTNGIWWNFLRAADINGDGLVDFFATGSQRILNGRIIDSVPMIWLNNGDGTFTTVNSAIFADMPGRLEVVDVDGDGQLDFVTGNLDLAGVLQYQSYLNRTPRTVPSEPLIGTAIAGDGKASIAFSKPLGGGVSPIAIYTATCGTGMVAANIVASGSASPITVSGLTNGKRYTCTLTATSAAGRSLPSATVTVMPVAVLLQSVTVVEFYNKSLDAYFITGRADEQATLDGLQAAFQRTGMTFQATSLATAPSSLTKICRFYISATQPFISSHFYGRQGADCDGIRDQNLPTFAWEGFDFAIQTTVDSCVAPIYRSFRAAANDKTPNHRYSAGLPDYSMLSAAGVFVGEGSVFCATASTPVTRNSTKSLFDPANERYR